MKFSHIIEKLVEENITHTHLEQGRKFEKLTQKILQLAPQFQSQFQDVYLWSEFSDEFGIHQKDTGVDLMAQTHDGQWVAIQCKCFDADYKLRLADLKGFLGIKSIYDSGGNLVCEIVQSLLFHTCKEVSAEVLKALKQSQNSASLEGRAYGYYDLEELGIDWRVFEYDNLQSLKIHTKKELRPHQKQAFEAIQKHFVQENNARARITMACGTGKSLLAIHTIDKLVDSGEIALFLAPSLALTNQMIGEFFKESHSDHYKVFAVCSDTKVGQKNKGSEDMNEDELCIAPTTNPHTLARAISHLFMPPLLIV